MKGKRKETEKTRLRSSCGIKHNAPLQ